MYKCLILKQIDKELKSLFKNKCINFTPFAVLDCLMTFRQASCSLKREHRKPLLHNLELQQVKVSWKGNGGEGVNCKALE